MMAWLDSQLERLAAVADRAEIPTAADVRRRGDARRRHRRLAVTAGSLLLLAVIATPVAIVLTGPSTRKISPTALTPTTTIPTRSTSTTIVPPVTGGAPTTGPVPMDCPSGSVSVAVPLTGPSASVCLHAGSTLTVTFDKSGGAIGLPGPWAVPPVRVDSPILGVISTSPRGAQLLAVFSAESPGTTIVYASFDEECSGGDKTPCTIPPLGMIELDVTVVDP
jgi:hypothetical protein